MHKAQTLGSDRPVSLYDVVFIGLSQDASTVSALPVIRWGEGIDFLGLQTYFLTLAFLGTEVLATGSVGASYTTQAFKGTST